MKKPMFKQTVNGIKKIANSGMKAMGTLIQKGGAKKPADMGGRSKAKVKPASSKAPAKGTFNAKKYDTVRRKVFGMTPNSEAHKEDSGKM